MEIVNCIYAPLPSGLRLLSVLKRGSVVVDLLFCVPPIVCGDPLVGPVFFYALLSVLSHLEIILRRKRAVCFN